jgi:hypothetical protein
MKTLLIISMIAMASSAFAGLNIGLTPVNNGGNKIEKCLQMASNYDLLNEVNRRMSIGQQPQPPVTNPNEHSCILVDSGFRKTFLGKGKSSLAAEANARQNCGSEVNSSYCNGSVRCMRAEIGSAGAFCIVKDSGFGKTFSAEGSDEIEAEALAKIACQKSVNASYCGTVTAKCETTY